MAHFKVASLLCSTLNSVSQGMFLKYPFAVKLDTQNTNKQKTQYSRVIIYVNAYLVRQNY